jgi:RNA recognition motif-containing protein
MGKFVIRLKFQGLEIRNGGNGIYIVYDNRGRPTGEAFVQFSNSEDTDLAMKKNREKIGQR